MGGIRSECGCEGKVPTQFSDDSDLSDDSDPASSEGSAEASGA